MNTKYELQLAALADMSNRYGKNAAYVLAGGGNTSYKSEENLWIKGSGTSLATIKPEDFVVMDRKALSNMWTAAYPAEEKAREAAVLEDMMAARIPGETRRPSVETLLHDLFPQKYILHLHPAMVNGLTCARLGKENTLRLFPDAVWVDACKPGYILALSCKEEMDAYTARTGKLCQLLFLQNHGIFFAADEVAGLDVLAEGVMSALQAEVTCAPDLASIPSDAAAVQALGDQLAALYGEGAQAVFTANKAIAAYDPTTGSLSPDHIVYAKARQLAVTKDSDIAAAFAAFTAETGYKPKIVFVQDLGMFSLGMSEKEASTAAAVMQDAICVVCYTQPYGGVQPMPDFLVDFIVNWEVESYRSKVSNG